MKENNKKVECPRCHRWYKPNGHDICDKCIEELKIIKEINYEKF